MKDQIRRCRKCGKPVSVITWGVYRKVLVDADPVWVSPDKEGREYVRVDGSKVCGIEVNMQSPVKSEPAYKQHRWTCGVEE